MPGEVGQGDDRVQLARSREALVSLSVDDLYILTDAVAWQYRNLHGSTHRLAGTCLAQMAGHKTARRHLAQRR